MATDPVTLEDGVRRSESRILTNHTETLHRPKELHGLVLQKYRGELAEPQAPADGAHIASSVEMTQGGPRVDPGQLEHNKRLIDKVFEVADGGTR